MEKGIIRDDDNIGKLNYWESYLTSLQKKYSDSIVLNYNEFNNIKLIKIDFVAFIPGAPFPQIVPGFPIFISSENLEYIKKYNKPN
jgi:hypothetical protein